MSLTKRTTTAARLAAPYSASQVPAATPSGAPMTMARTHMTAEPNSALRRPPSAAGGRRRVEQARRALAARDRRGVQAVAQASGDELVAGADGDVDRRGAYRGARAQAVRPGAVARCPHGGRDERGHAVGAAAVEL